MELQFDISKIYAIALEGGGARGAWQVGAWRALEEAGVRYNAVSGTSVGAINGALMAMRDLPQAEAVWKDIRFSQVVNADDETMKRIMNRDFDTLGQVKDALHTIKGILKDRGLDVEPLRNMLAERVDEERIRNSGVEFFLTTVDVTDLKELVVSAGELPPGALKDMIMASAYHPAFKQEKIGGKTYADGGFYDGLPIRPLVDHGYKNIIALRIYGGGINRKVRQEDGVTITVIGPNTSLGSVLNFSSDQSAVNMALGYYDTQKVLYGLYGRDYYIDRTMTEKEAYEILLAHLWNGQVSLRKLNEEVLPGFAKKLGVAGDYYDLFITMTERLAQSCDLTPFRIRTDREFYEEVMALRRDDIPDKPDKILDQYLYE